MPQTIYGLAYPGRYQYRERVPAHTQLAPFGRVNSSSITASSTAAAPYGVSLGVAVKAGDLILVAGATNGTHVSNGMVAYDTVSGRSYPTILEVQNTNASSRWGQAFAFVTPVDLPSTTQIMFTPYAASTLSSFSVDIFRGWTATQVATATSAFQAPGGGTGVTVGAPGFATIPPIGSLVVAFFSAASTALTVRSPFTIASSTTSNEDTAIAYVIATGTDPYPSTGDLAAANSWGVINAAFGAGFGPVWAWLSVPPSFRSRYNLPYLNQYRWTPPPGSAVVVSGGTQFQQSLTAGLSFTGPTNLKNAISKQMTGGLSFTGPTNLKNAITKGLTAVLSFTGATNLKNAITKTLAAAGLSFTGAQTRATSYHLAGGLSFAGAISSSHVFLKSLTGGLSFTGVTNLSNAIRKTLTGGLSFTGATNLKNVVSKTITGGLSFTGARVSAIRTHLMGGFLDLFSTPNLVTNPSFETGINNGWVTYTSAGTPTQVADTTQFLAGVESVHVFASVLTDGGVTQAMGVLPAGAYAFGAYYKTGTISGGCAVIRRNSDFAVVAGQSFTGSNLDWTKSQGVFIADGVLSYDIILGLGSYGPQSTGDVWFDAVELHSIRSGPQFLLKKNLVAAALGFVGSLTSHNVLHGNLSGVLSFAGAQSHAVGKSLSGALSFTGAQTRRVGKTMTAALGFVGAQARAIRTNLTASLTFSGAIGKRVPKIFSGALGFIGNLTRNLLHLPPALEPIKLMGRDVALSMTAPDGTATIKGGDRALPMAAPDATITVIGGSVGPLE